MDIDGLLFSFDEISLIFPSDFFEGKADIGASIYNSVPSIRFCLTRAKDVLHTNMEKIYMYLNLENICILKILYSCKRKCALTFSSVFIFISSKSIVCPVPDTYLLTYLLLYYIRYMIYLVLMYRKTSLRFSYI